MTIFALPLNLSGKCRHTKLRNSLLVEIYECVDAVVYGLERIGQSVCNYSSTIKANQSILMHSHFNRYRAHLKHNASGKYALR